MLRDQSSNEAECPDVKDELQHTLASWVHIPKHQSSYDERYQKSRKAQWAIVQKTL
jgi:hypothetical protein